MSSSFIDPVANLINHANQALDRSVREPGTRITGPPPKADEIAGIRSLIDSLDHIPLGASEPSDFDDVLQGVVVLSREPGSPQQNQEKQEAAAQINSLINNLRGTVAAQSEALKEVKAGLEQLAATRRNNDPAAEVAPRDDSPGVIAVPGGMPQASLEASAPMMLVGRHRYSIAWGLLILAFLSVAGGIVMLSIASDDTGIALMTGFGTVVSVLGAWFVTMGYGSVRIHTGAAVPAKNGRPTNGTS